MNKSTCAVNCAHGKLRQRRYILSQRSPNIVDENKLNSLVGQVL